MNELDKSRHTGIFRISPDREVNGILSLDGLDSSLHVWDKEPFVLKPHQKALTGVLHNQTKLTEVHDNPTKLTEVLRSPTKVSLIDCITFGHGSCCVRDDKAYFYDIFPTYVIFGEDHIYDEDEKIIESCLLVDDATDIFYDTGIFGLVRDPYRVMKEIIDNRNSNHDVSMGEDPLVA